MYGLDGSKFVRAYDFLYPEVQSKQTQLVLRKRRRKEFAPPPLTGVFVYDTLATGSFEQRSPVIIFSNYIEKNLEETPTLLDMLQIALSEDPQREKMRNVGKEGESKATSLLAVVEEVSHFMHVQMNVTLGALSIRGIGEGMVARF